MWGGVFKTLIELASPLSRRTCFSKALHLTEPQFLVTSTVMSDYFAKLLCNFNELMLVKEFGWLKMKN